MAVLMLAQGGGFSGRCLGEADLEVPNALLVNAILSRKKKRVGKLRPWPSCPESTDLEVL